MAKKEDELFKEWVTDVQSGLETEDEKKAFEVFASSKAGRETLRGGMRRQEFDKRLNEIHEQRNQLEVADRVLKSKIQENKEWFESEAPKNQALVQELNALKSKLREATGEDDPPPAQQTVAQVPFKIEEYENLKKEFGLLNANLPRVMGDMTAIIKRSIKEDFDIDPREVIAYSIKNQVDPYRAYEDLTHEARAERFEKDREKQLADAREEGRKEGLKTIKSSPDHIRTPGPNVVDYLRTIETPVNRRDRVDASVKDFLELTSAQ